MKSFKELSGRQKILVITAGLLAGGVFLIQDDEQGTSVQNVYPDQKAAYAVNAPNADGITQDRGNGKHSSAGRVVLYDQASQQPMGTYILPDGWKLDQDVAIDPATNSPTRYKIDLYGPQGALIRALGSSRYGQMAGMNFQQSLYQLVAGGMQGVLENYSLGNPQPDPVSPQRLMKNRVYKRLVSQGNQVLSQQIPLRGTRNGKTYEGYVQYTRVTPAANPETYGTIAASFVIGPEGQGSALLNIKNQIDDQYEADPSFEQYREQLQAQVMQRNGQFHEDQMRRSRSLHETRMKSAKDRFDAHQKNISELNGIQDQSFNSFMDGLNNSGSSSGNSDYTGHDAFIDGIHERTTFDDPDSGFPRSLDGDYKYNYTDGQGNYYRTDDPSFDPHSLPGDWQEIEPMTNDY